MKKENILLLLVWVVLLNTPLVLFAQQNTTTSTSSLYWTGDGGRGMTITVAELTGIGLLGDEQHLLPLIQDNLTGIFQRYTAMTVFDQIHNEQILNQQTRSLSGDFSETVPIQLGRLVNARLVVFGSITKIGNSFMLDLAVTDVQSGERVASVIPHQVTSLALRNFSAIREAALELLEQININPTDLARQELSRAEENISRIDSEDARSRGRVAERDGNQIAAMSYYFQAASFDPAARDALNRISILSATVSQGNIETFVMNRLQEHDAWRSLVEEAKRFYGTHYPYIFRYNPIVEYENVNLNFERRTAEFAVPIRIEPSDDWQTINDLRRGLNRARGRDQWDFNLNRVSPSSIIVVLEVVDQNGRVLTSQQHRFDNPSGVMDATVSFIISDIENMDGLSIRVASINNNPVDAGMMRVIPEGVYLRVQRSRNDVSLLKSYYFKYNFLTNYHFNEEKSDNGVYKIMDLGLYAQFIPLTLAGFEVGVGLYFDNFKSQETYYNFSPTLGFLIPMTKNTEFYAQGFLDIGSFGGEWKGLISDEITPSFNVGFISDNFSPFGKTGFNYKGTWYQDVYTHGFSIDFWFLNNMGFFSRNFLENK
ncbi:MAG: hypothetical protein FWG98_05430 [Candidatus Cloacimonetes bacterium]|nr:hypothetical protein [Candidatus Cloacimonadota bacterium]